MKKTTKITIPGMENRLHNKSRFNVGHFGRTKQLSIYNDENKEMNKREREIHDSQKLQNSFDKREEPGFNVEDDNIINPRSSLTRSDLGKAERLGNKNYGDADIMAKPYQKPTGKKTDAPRSSGNRTIDNEVDAWLNIGGKAFFVKIEGVSYMTSIDSVRDLLDGNKKGVKLGRIEEE